MKKFIHLNTLIGLFAITTLAVNAQNVGINTTGTVPNSSALLDLNTGNTFTSPNGKGLLVPNVALTSVNDAVTIASPATSLLVYVPAGSGLSPAGYYYNGGTPAVPNWQLFITAASGTAWNTLGNAGTNVATNFLGTTDANALEFRVDNQEAAYMDFAGNQATVFGFQALAGVPAAGKFNTAIGYEALNTNSTGKDNTGVGNSALSTNTSGNDNTAVGFSALQSNTARNNTAVGSQSLGNLPGNDNVAIGYFALNDATSALQNVAVGSGALENNGNGQGNTAVGYQALINNSGVNYNTAVGDEALSANTSGQFNNAVGTSALQLNQTGNDNVAQGALALDQNLIGNGNIAVGFEALYFNTASNNVAIGNDALENNTGAGNTAIGANALITNHTGTDNTGIGFQANVGAFNLSNTTAVGANTTVDTSNTVLLGNTAVNRITFNGNLMPWYSGNFQAGSVGKIFFSTGFGNGDQWQYPNSVQLESASATLNIATANTWIFSGAGLTATLPAASANITNMSFTIVSQTAALTISSYQNLSGAATTTVPAGTSISVICTGAAWVQYR